MSTPSRAERAGGWLQTTVVVVALIATTVALRIPLLMQPQPIDDEVNYTLVAHELQRGGQLYTDIVERRPPLTFWVYEGIFRVFGAENWRALHAAAVVWVLLTMLAIYVLTARLFGRRVGVVAALLYSVFQPWWYWGNLAFNGEVLMNLPVACAFAVALTPGRQWHWARGLLAGALVAIGFLLKQPAAIAIVPLAWYAADPARRSALSKTNAKSMSGVISLGVGAGLVLAAVIVWLVGRHVAGAGIYWSILDHDVPYVFWTQAAGRTALFALVCLPLLAAVVMRFNRGGTWRSLLPERDALAGLAAASAIGAAASGRFFPHYYIGILPALVVLAAPAMAAAWTRNAGTRGPVTLVMRAWVPALVILSIFLNAARASDLPTDTDAGRYLRVHAPPDARVFVWGRMPRIYVDSERRPAARYIDTFALTGRMFGPRLPGIDTRNRIVPGAWDQLKADFAAHPPEFIVDTECGPSAENPVSAFPWFDGLLRTGYVPVAQVTEGRIYRRAPASLAALLR